VFVIDNFNQNNGPANGPNGNQLWDAFDPVNGPAMQETGGRLVMDLTCPSACSGFDDAELLGDAFFLVGGNFELLVDFSNFAPVSGAGNQEVRAGLRVTIGGTTLEVDRVSCQGSCAVSGNAYAVFRNGTLLGFSPPTSDTSGTLRIVRPAGNPTNFIFYYRSSPAGQPVVFSSITSSNESAANVTTGLFLERRAGGFSGHVEWDNVNLPAGTCIGC